MLEKRVIDATIASSFRSMLENWSRESGLVEPVLGLLWGTEDNSEEYYMIGFYERAQLPTDDPVRLIDVDGIEFLVIQDWICDEIEGKALDFVDGKITLVACR